MASKAFYLRNCAAQLTSSPEGNPLLKGSHGRESAHRLAIGTLGPKMVIPRGSPPEVAASMFKPPMLAEVHSFESFRGFHEFDSPVIVADYLLPQNPRVVWATAWRTCKVPKLSLPKGGIISAAAAESKARYGPLSRSE